MKRLVWLLVLGVLVWFGLGYADEEQGHHHGGDHHTEEAAEEEQAVEYWTCSMHPDVRAARPGECPVCGMYLVPVYAAGDEEGERGHDHDGDEHSDHHSADHHHNE